MAFQSAAISALSNLNQTLALSILPGSTTDIEALQGKQLALERTIDERFLPYTYNCEGPKERIHTDVWGPIKVPARNGETQMITFTDDYSLKAWVYSIPPV